MNKKIVLMAVSAAIFSGGALADSYNATNTNTTTTTTATTTNITNDIRQLTSSSGSYSDSVSNSGSTSFASGGAGGSASARGGSSDQGQMQQQSADNAGNVQNITFNSPPSNRGTRSDPEAIETTSTNTSNVNQKSESNDKLKQKIDYSGSYKLENVPAMAAPGLTTTLTETCMGSTSGAFAIAGLGVSGGTTWTDKNCVRRLDAREIRAMGAAEVAKELMCTGENNYNAFKRAAKKLNKPSLACVPNPEFDNPTKVAGETKNEDKTAMIDDTPTIFGFNGAPVKEDVAIVAPKPEAKVAEVAPVKEERTEVKSYGYMKLATPATPAKAQKEIPNSDTIFMIGN